MGGVWGNKVLTGVGRGVQGRYGVGSSDKHEQCEMEAGGSESNERGSVQHRFFFPGLCVDGFVHDTFCTHYFPLKNCYSGVQKLSKKEAAETSQLLRK